MNAARVHHAARRRGGGWPLAARAQQRERMRRSGVHARSARTIRNMRPVSRRFCKGCSELGWIVGRNVRIDTAGRGDLERYRSDRGRIDRTVTGRRLGSGATRP